MNKLNKRDYMMLLSVFDKQQRGEELPKSYKKWKKQYNKKREENVYYENDIKVTRYKPNWM